MKYVSLDIETTGLLPDFHQIIEVGAVIEDTENRELGVEQLPSLRILVANEDNELANVNVDCALMHQKLWQELKGVQQDVLDEDGYYVQDLSDWQTAFQGCANLRVVVARPGLVQTVLRDWLNEHGIEDVEITVAGKNVASFDAPFMRALPGWDSEYLDFHRRMIDPAILFFEPSQDTTTLPRLSECLNRAGMVHHLAGEHEALFDARNVVRLVRAGLARLI